MRSDQFAPNSESQSAAPAPSVRPATSSESASLKSRLYSGVLANDEPTERPTNVRYGVLFFLCTMAMLLYLDRSCIGIAAKRMQEDLGLTKLQWSFVLNGFTLAYCLFEVPTGHWGDRYGSRGVIARIVIWWSAFTALTGAMNGLWTLVAVRFLFGAGEAGAFPNAALVLTKWFPVRQRGRVRGLITTVSMLGAAAAPLVATFLMQTIGWRWMFGVFGAIGVVWAGLFYWWFRDRPSDHPRANDAERRYIEADHAPIDPASHAEHHPIPWGIVLTSPNVWFLGTIMMVSATLFYLQFQWYPIYLTEGRGVSEGTSSWMNMFVMLGGATGCVLGGMLSDAVLQRTNERKWSRRFCGAGALVLSGAAVAGVALSESPRTATVFNVFALMFLQMSVPTWWTVVSEISGRHGASMWGLMNSMGGLGVLCSTTAIGWYIDYRKNLQFVGRDLYDAIFVVMGGLLVFGACLWMFIDPTRSIVERAGTTDAS